MNIVFRVDASPQIGTGHWMRCLTLAAELRKRGCEAHFICNPLPEGLARSVETDCLHILEAGDEMGQIQRIISELGDCDWLIVDHYGWSREQELPLRSAVRHILVIDDLADRMHDCDVLVDQNYFEHPEVRYEGLIPKHCRELLGPKYSLLRPEFSQQRKIAQERLFLKETLHVLVSFGGSDPTGETLKTIEALSHLNLNHLEVQVVAGAANPALAEIQARCADMVNTECLTHIDNMAERMVWADLFIGAGGTTTWERMALGLPGIVVAIADNQVELSQAVANIGAHVYLGESAEVTPHQLQHAVQLLLSQAGLRRHMSEKAMTLVDGLGCSRVADAMLPMALELRRVTEADSRKLFEWRNHEEVRRYSLNSDSIVWETHEQWFQGSLVNPKRVLLIAEKNGEAVGVLRYDIHAQDETRCVVSIYRVPGLALPGVGSRLLEAGSTWLQQNYPRLQTIEAEILPENVASRKAFEKAGYVLHHQIYEKQLGVKLPV